MKWLFCLMFLFGISSNAYAGEYLGKYTINPYARDSVKNPYNQYGSPYSYKSINNPYGKYGSPYSSYSVNNPYTYNAPKLYDSSGNYRGKLSSNPYDSESISNPYSRYDLNLW